MWEIFVGFAHVVSAASLLCNSSAPLPSKSLIIYPLLSFYFIGMLGKLMTMFCVMPSFSFLIADRGKRNLWQILARDTKLDIHSPFEYFSLEQTVLKFLQV